MAVRKIILSPVEDDVRIPTAVEVLRGYCSTYGISVDDGVLTTCVHHLLYTLQVNECINLTRITSFDEALVLHILDSLLLLPFMPDGVARFLDMGTGAGFPGIPLAAATSTEGVLLDSVSKKVEAVDAFAKALHLDCVAAVHDRLESYAQKERASFDMVVARAVAPIDILLEYARPFLKTGGSLLITKGVPTEDELAAGTLVAEKLGYRLMEQHGCELSNDAGHRTILRYCVTRPASIKLPRQIGAARKNPLALMFHVKHNGD